jgi:hypothetical protein
MNSPPKTTRLESEALVQRGVTHHAGNITPILEAFVSNRELPELCLQSRTGVSPNRELNPRIVSNREFDWKRH